jgi:hypothetical protein
MPEAATKDSILGGACHDLRTPTAKMKCAQEADYGTVVTTAEY